MEDRAEVLRRKLAAYRRRLAEGVDADLALHYLLEIIAAEAELAELGRDADRRAQGRRRLARAPGFNVRSAAGEDP